MSLQYMRNLILQKTNVVFVPTWTRHSNVTFCSSLMSSPGFESIIEGLLDPKLLEDLKQFKGKIFFFVP